MFELSRFEVSYLEKGYKNDLIMVMFIIRNCGLKCLKNNGKKNLFLVKLKLLVD